MKGLSFSEPMVKAWMEGRKTVTRRLVNPQPELGVSICAFSGTEWGYEDEKGVCTCVPAKPRYLSGEKVYIKETWAQHKYLTSQSVGKIGAGFIFYRADYGVRTGQPGKDVPIQKWKSPRFMPEWAARSHALIVSVRPEKIREITPAEVKREGLVVQDFAGIGVLACLGMTPETYMESVAIMEFQSLWEQIHPGSWERNDWVWRIELNKGVNDGKSNITEA